MPAHKLQITYDESTGVLTVVHRCVSPLAGHPVSRAEELVLDDASKATVTAICKSLVDGPTVDVKSESSDELIKVEAANRVEMERRAAEDAIEHVAALNNVAKKNTKRIQLGGSVGAVGDVALKAKE